MVWWILAIIGSFASGFTAGLWVAFAHRERLNKATYHAMNEVGNELKAFINQGEDIER